MFKHLDTYIHLDGTCAMQRPKGSYSCTIFDKVFSY